MSKTYRTIPFFSDEIKIRPHTATRAEHVGRAVSLSTFANGEPLRLRQCLETGEYLAERVPFPGRPRPPVPTFIEGPEV